MKWAQNTQVSPQVFKPQPWRNLALCTLILFFSCTPGGYTPPAPPPTKKASATTTPSALPSPPSLQAWTLLAAHLAPDGSLLRCVQDHVQAGGIVQEAMKTCRFTDEFLTLDRPGKSVNSFLAIGGQTQGTQVAVGTCSAHGTDPRRAQQSNFHSYASHPSTNAPQNPNENRVYKDSPEYRRLAAKAQQEWQRYVEALEKASGAPTDSPEALLLDQEMLKAQQDANKAIEDRDAWVPTHSQTDPTASDTPSDVCRAMMEFILECNSRSWQTKKCQDAMWKMRKCSDPSITTPMPDGDLVCPLDGTEVVAETVGQVGVIACQMRIKPEPGTDPCEPTTLDAITVHGYFPVRFCEGGREGDRGSSCRNATPCGDPRALTGEEQCSPTLTLSTFGTKDLQAIADFIREKVGGPVFIIPLPRPPGPVGPGPE